MRRAAAGAAVLCVVTWPDETLNTVRRRDWSGAGVVEGGGTEKSARSCASVSRISEVMSELLRSALVKILGGGKLTQGPALM